jgi:sec-independent protein translocase protein TatA
MPLLAPGIGPLGLPELIIIAFIVILIFGVGRLPEVGGAVGKSIKEFRKSTKDEDDAPVDQSAAAPDATAAPVASTVGATAGAATAAPPAAPISAAPAPPPAATADNAAETRFCSECGARNTRTAKFCAECGNAMAAAAR